VLAGRLSRNADRDGSEFNLLFNCHTTCCSETGYQTVGCVSKQTKQSLVETVHHVDSVII
jgi:hypothetical protein